MIKICPLCTKDLTESYTSTHYNEYECKFGHYKLSIDSINNDLEEEVHISKYSILSRNNITSIFYADLGYMDDQNFITELNYKIIISDEKSLIKRLDLLITLL